ncbi:MAG: MotA/TolQ/ExbB proton channel family protein [Sulfurimonas sp.]|nr:MotA/TolQ/ExbB proton channel family protein [Sulfurimonas sp.]
MKQLLSLLLILCVSLFGATDTDLERAYAKEFAYLKAQKEMLQTRLGSIQGEQNKKLSQAKTDLERLQATVLQKNTLSEKLESDLYRTQQNASNLTDDVAIIDSVMMQANSSLDSYGITIEEDKNNYQAALENVFTESDKLIKELSSTRVTKGTFYNEDGSKENGELVKVGNIATFGISTDTAAALVPAGDGNMKVWNAPEAASTAKALKNRNYSEQLNIFIYENPTLEIENVKEKTLIEIIDSAGIIGWIIVILGLVGLGLALLRTLFLSSASSSTSDLAKATLSKLLANGVDGALEFLQNKKGSTARVLKATIRNLDRDREHIEDIVAESILHESGRLDKFGSILMVIAAVAPLLGLLGTVTGMIATFDIITEFGTGDPKLLSGGISIALVTTELGLIVAIPILMIGNILGGWAERVKDSMEHSALHLINEYNKQK